MATDAPITGAPTRAPSNLIPFPDTTVARLRRNLIVCRDHMALMRWSGQVKRSPGLTADDRLDLTRRFARRHLEIGLAGVR